MARVTVEDCLNHVDNRFELVMIASKRARQLANNGRTPQVEEENDKPTVIALRELADGVVDAAFIEREDLIEREPIFISLPDDNDEFF